MEDIVNLREYSSTNYCLSEIPLRIRRGLAIVDVQFTYIDAVEEYIAVGTNIGIVYWCNRCKNKIERLRPEKCGPKITYVKVISSVDYMVAAGDESGTVSIFIIPKEKLLLLPTDKGRPPQHSIERFTVSDIHSSPITAIEWSLNGQKLFTGDEKGLIVFTQVDFHLNIIKSTEILNEKFPIVQLSYSQPQMLLIASEYRCIIYNQGKDGKTLQVGQKDRLNLCKLGAVMCSNIGAKPVIYSARPKQRICLSDIEGNVQKTFLFKDALSKEHPIIQIIDERYQSFTRNNENRNLGDTQCSQSFIHESTNQPGSVPSKTTASELEFCTVKFYKNKFLLVFDSNAIALLNVEDTSVAGGLYSLRKIISVAVNKEEIFILEGNRRIRRLATHKDRYWHLKSNVPESNRDSQIGEKLLDIVSKIKDEASTTMMQPLMSNLTRNDMMGERFTDMEPISPAEDALLSLTADEKIFSIENNEKVDSSLKNENYGDIVFNRKKKHSTEVKKHTLLESTDGDPSQVFDNLNLKDCDNELTSGSVKDIREIEAEIMQASVEDDIDIIPSKEIPDDILPDLRNINSILEDVKYKEDKLAELLNMAINTEVVPNSNHSSSYPEEKLLKILKSSDSSRETNDTDTIISPQELLNNDDENLCKNQQYCQMVEDENIEEKVETDRQNENDPIDHTNDHETIGQVERAAEISNHFAQNNYEDSWITCFLPNLSKWICVTKTGIYHGGPKSTVHYSETKDLKLNWKLLNYRAVKMSVSLSGSILWKLDLGVAYAYSTDLINRWKIIARNVESIAVNENSAWYVSDGNVYVQFDLNEENPYSEESFKANCPEKISKVYCFEDTVWALSKKGRIWSKHCITDCDWRQKPWKNVSLPENVTISDIALGCKNTGWIATTNNEIFFTDNFTTSDVPNWWQVVLSNAIYKNNSALLNLNKLVHWSKDRIGCSIASSDRAIWVLHHDENILQVNQTAVEGHRWIPFRFDLEGYNLKWKFISASETTKKMTILWCLSTNNDLFSLNPLTKRVRAIDAATTEDIVCVTAGANALCVLTKTGIIYSRLGMNDKNQFGSLWVPTTFKNANNSAMKFQYFSLGNDVIWAIDDDGKVFCAVGNPLDITSEVIFPDWVHIKDLPSNDLKFKEVVVGQPNSYMVWAVDHKCNVYVRQGVFTDFLFGTEWISVSGIRAVHLVISPSAVWALTPEGNIYCRFGISPINYIGDYWLQIPGSFSLITASNIEGLWGMSSVTGHLHRYEKHVLDLLKKKDPNKKLSESTDEEWELV